jgi:hypothetical protein
MLKIWLCLGLFMVLLAIPSYATAVTMLPNATHGMSYKMAADETCVGTPADATTAYADADYANANTSNDGYFAMTASAGKTDFTGDCIHTRYTFNVTLVNTTAIQWIKYCIEGKNHLTEGSEGAGNLWYKNSTAWYQNTSLTETDTTYCFNYTSPEPYIVGGLFSIGADASAYGTGTQTSNAITSVDYVNVTVGYQGVTNTCTYGGSGNWNININDNCTISSATTVTGNVNIYGSNGVLTFANTVKANAFYYNVTSGGTWYYNNYRWLY